MTLEVEAGMLENFKKLLSMVFSELVKAKDRSSKYRCMPAIAVIFRITVLFWCVVV